jgi:hypothetical protein
MMRIVSRGEVRMKQCKLLALLMLMAMPASAQSSKPRFRSDSDRMCKAALADGTPYEVWHRVLVTEGKGQPPYVGVWAYYRPGSGEFLWNSSGSSKKEVEKELKYNSKWPATCDNPNNHIVLLQDGEWVDFWGFNSQIKVFHCNLRFETREKAWSHVAEHWPDASFGGGPLAKWVENIQLDQQLGNTFFRSKRSEFDARPIFFEPLVSAKKAGSHWELEIKGADEPNRATVWLDSNFKLIQVTKNPVTH